MTKPRDPKISLFDILMCAQNCINFTKGMTFDIFEKDIKTISAVQHQILIIGEATKRLPAEFRQLHFSIPWKEMAGTRDILIHAYEEADYKIIWDIATQKMKEIIPKIEKILASL